MLRRLQLILALALAFIAGPAFAQQDDGFTLLGVDNGFTVVAGGSYSGPVDAAAAGNPTYCFSLRPCAAAFADGTHIGVKLKRNSDGETCDVLFTTSGDWGNTANCSGADSGVPVSTYANATTITLDALYNQYNSAQQMWADIGHGPEPPITLACVNGKPCTATTGTQGMVLNAALTAINQPLTISSVARRTGNFSAQSDILGASQGTFYGPSANSVGAYFGALDGVSATDSAWHAVQIVPNGSSSIFNVDGVETASKVLGSIAFPNSFYWFEQSQTFYLTGGINETIVWSSTLNSTQRNAVASNQRAYWGF